MFTSTQTRTFLTLTSFGSGDHIKNLADETVIEFANGTTRRYNNTATVQANFTGIETGNDLHQAVEIDGSILIPWYNPDISDIYNISAYPPPLVADPGNYIHGHFLTSGMNDTAVLVLHSFIPPIFQSPRQVIEDAKSLLKSFIEACKEAGKTKLVLDLQSNGGGLEPLMQVLLNALFPTSPRTLFSGARYRATPTLDFIARALASLNDTKIPPFGIDAAFDEQGVAYRSWEAMFGPVGLLGDKFTNIINPQIGATGPQLRDVQIDGLTEQLFLPENIVVLTNGICDSACALFVGSLARDRGIRTIAVGGRPLEAPMQAIGGTKGGPVVSLGTIQRRVLRLREAVAEAKAPVDVDLFPLAGQEPPFGGSAQDMTINFGNQHQRRDSSGWPMQFMYEAANCKLFLTKGTAASVQKLWEVIAEVAWGRGKCVPGSTTNHDGSIGNSALPYSPEVR
jgi:hypothetical protein